MKLKPESYIAIVMLLTAAYLLTDSIVFLTYDKPYFRRQLKTDTSAGEAAENISSPSVNHSVNISGPQADASAKISENKFSVSRNEINSQLTVSNPPENLPEINSSEIIDDNRVFTAVEENPSFPGGDAARIKFLRQNIKYPLEAQRKRIQGQVIISFIVEKDGTVSNIKLLKSLCKECDDEAMRVAALMPAWIPGRQSGNPVRVFFNMPISFKLQF